MRYLTNWSERRETGHPSQFCQGLYGEYGEDREPKAPEALLFRLLRVALPSLSFGEPPLEYEFRWNIT